MVSRSTALVIVFVAVLAVLLYEPIPKGYTPISSIKLRVLAATFKAVKFVADTSERWCPGYGVKVRRAACKLTAPVSRDDSVRAYDTEFDGVSVRVYEPVERKNKLLPGIVYYHGGGFTICDVESYDRLVRELSKMTNTVVASVDYRLAPEHHYPAAHDDALTAIKYFIKNSKMFHVDQQRIAVAGDSAGGNLAASMSLMLRDANYTPSVKLQVLIYPSLQLLDLRLPSMVDNKLDPCLKTEEIAYYYSNYLDVTDHMETFASNSHVPGAVRKQLSRSYINIDRLPSQYTAHFHAHKSKNGDEKLWSKIKSALLNPYLCPLVAPSLEGLPQAYIYSCEHDVVRDEGFLYADRLREAGVVVEQFNDPLGFHWNLQIALDMPEVEQSMRRIAEYITANL